MLLQLSEPDDITLDIQGQLLKVLEDSQATPGATDALPEDSDDDGAGPLTIAVDVDAVDVADTPVTAAP